MTQEKLNHTPGPWAEFAESGDWWIGQADTDGGPGLVTICETNGTAEGDVNLICAAPLLYAAAKSDMRAFDRITELINECRDGKCNVDTTLDLIANFAAAPAVASIIRKLDTPPEWTQDKPDATGIIHILGNR